MDISQAVRLLLSNQGCGLLPVEEIQDGSLLYEIGFDSLRYMELVVLLEEQFAFEFQDDQLEISEATSVSDIIKTVQGSVQA
ncbi:acyl carrier protein [Paenibacillus sambharensis]|uniref:Acyl carrier protein n=1 Tax=Paenibacillus sambharensis TaxID=1803190 RepID=A0A2W1LQP6_9BACL|nr:phosphopantetheine-binding protein [Paenibacillus sambharensis]PZD96834.1 acyl carrier protein [Paenibacillus sambharensis]